MENVHTHSVFQFSQDKCALVCFPEATIFPSAAKTFAASLKNQECKKKIAKYASLLRHFQFKLLVIEILKIFIHYVRKHQTYDYKKFNLALCG